MIESILQENLEVKIKQDSKNPNKYEIIISPLYPGYGNTIANSLRRILLSSLEGAAVTSVKIRGVDHEFSTIDGIKEDVLSILLNLKNLRVKLLSNDPQKLILSVSGKKEVKAKDFQKNPMVEIINKDLKIATLTSKDSSLDMEIKIEKGRGYVPTEQRGEETEIGVIPIDAIFTPILDVGYKIEDVRVKDRTDFNKIIMNIETDGTIDGKTAITQAIEILINHFQKIKKSLK